MQLAVNFKVYVSTFILNALFDSVKKSIQTSTDTLVIENASLQNKQGYAFMLDGHQFIHSSAFASNQNTLSFLQLNRSEMLIAHDDIIPKALKLLDYINSQSIDQMRFKGLINGMLSVVKSSQDFDIIFNDMFTDEIQALNKAENLKLCSSPNPPKLGDTGVTLSEADIEKVNDIKAAFKTQYDRYRFMKEVLGI